MRAAIAECGTLLLPEARKYAILRTSLVTGGTAPHVALQRGTVTTSLVNLVSFVNY